MGVVLLNGDFLPVSEAKVSVLDRGFLFADGVYEVIPVYQGRIFWYEKHLQRLHRSLKSLDMSLPVSEEQLHASLMQLIELNGGGDLSLYLQITRGVGSVRSHPYQNQILKPTWFSMCSPISPANYTQGQSAVLLEDIRWGRADIKSTALLANILLVQQAINLGAFEAILCRQDVITEGAASNVFMVKDDVIMTPEKSHFILGGVTRDLLVELALQNGLNCVEKQISAQALKQADEIWITSSTREIVPIVKLDARPVGDGELGRHWGIMNDLYKKMIDKQLV